MAKLKEPTEHQEQSAFVSWCKAKKILVVAVSNGFFTNKRDNKFYGQIAKLKAEGYSKGFPDLIVIIQDKVLFIEMKRKKTGVASSEQKAWIMAISELGHPVSICRGCDRAIEFVLSEMVEK